jgi:hypothetical protein
MRTSSPSAVTEQPARPDVAPSATARRLALALLVWCAAYAGYRGYYALGGQLGVIGRPVSESQLRAINAVGAAIILLAGILPVVAVRVGPLRRTLPVLGWIGAVGCCMHAFVDSILRVLSITGVHPTQLPSSVWVSFDRAAADWQDLLLNEPWFLVTGLLWGALGLVHVRPDRRRAWLLSALVACLLLTVVGVLSGLELVATFHLG